MSWLYLASLSERASEPVLICPQLVATARSAIVESSVSPEGSDIHFYLDFEFGVPLLRQIIQPMMGRVVEKFVSAFEDRALEIYS